MLDMATLLAVAVDYALLLECGGANNYAKYGYIVSHGGGLCAVVGGKWLT